MGKGVTVELPAEGRDDGFRVFPHAWDAPIDEETVIGHCPVHGPRTQANAGFLDCAVGVELHETDDPSSPTFFSPVGPIVGFSHGMCCWEDACGKTLTWPARRAKATE